MTTEEKFDNHLSFQHNRDLKNQFNILSAQSLNLAVQENPKGKDSELLEQAKRFFHLLINLRTDKDLIGLFEEYSCVKNTEEKAL